MKPLTPDGKPWFTEPVVAEDLYLDDSGEPTCTVLATVPEVDDRLDEMVVRGFINIALFHGRRLDVTYVGLQVDEHGLDSPAEHTLLGVEPKYIIDGLQEWVARDRAGVAHHVPLEMCTKIGIAS